MKIPPSVANCRTKRENSKFKIFHHLRTLHSRWNCRRPFSIPVKVIHFPARNNSSKKNTRCSDTKFYVTNSHEARKKRNNIQSFHVVAFYDTLRNITRSDKFNITTGMSREGLARHTQQQLDIRRWWYGVGTSKCAPNNNAISLVVLYVLALTITNRVRCSQTSQNPSIISFAGKGGEFLKLCDRLTLFCFHFKRTTNSPCQSEFPGKSTYMLAGAY